MNDSSIASQNQGHVGFGLSPNGYGFTYFSLIDFRRGDVVMSGYGKLIDHQTRHISVQIGIQLHYLPTKWTGKYWNHSCEPNTHARTREDGFPDLVALRDIRPGEEITYAYWMTELAWIPDADETKISCRCGSRRCRGRIYSFSELSSGEKAQLRKKNHISSYLQKV